ncbi:MAG: FecR family protein [Chitinophagaceae bacterium]|nr:FecR family protein [Chitinophagaceae bacterium]
MPVRLSVEELVINDSFINYCLERNEQDVLHWLQYQEDHPDRQDIIEEAKQLVFLMTGSLRGLAAGTPAAPVFPIKRFPLLKVMGWAAACTGIVLTTYFVFQQKKEVGMHEAVAAVENPRVFTTKAGAKQTITLPDGTKVYLNSGSTLKLSDGFGKANRKVFLTGEGGFDVIHNSRLPFTVSVDKYDVNVTGTFFNVRAYPGDKITETSLLRGKVDILIKNGSSTPLRMLLKPKQKFVLDTETGEQMTGGSDPEAPESKAAPHVAIEALSYNRDSVNIETAWIQNTLIIEEETFEMIREKLERWYNVRLIFKDEKVKQYGFTGTFRNESIEQVLKAFKDSYFFNYTIDGTDIIISK